jgi:hypothetical protein
VGEREVRPPGAPTAAAPPFRRKRLAESLHFPERASGSVRRLEMATQASLCAFRELIPCQLPGPDGTLAAQ